MVVYDIARCVEGSMLKNSVNTNDNLRKLTIISCWKKLNRKYETYKQAYICYVKSQLWYLNDMDKISP